MKLALALSVMFVLFICIGCQQVKVDQQVTISKEAIDQAAKGDINTYVVPQQPNQEPASPAKVVEPASASAQNPVTEKKVRVLLETNMGNITIELYDHMPITVGNFLQLVEKGFYDRVIFHRIVPNFMIQGGDPTGTGTGGPGYTIRDEFIGDNRNDRGTISMANAGPNTGGSQFFINLVNNNFLDSKHPVFGKVVSGMDVVDKISLVKRDSNDRPLQDIVIEKAVVVK